MRAAIFRNGRIVADTCPEPKPAAGQVLVKTLACGICGSDLHARQHAHRMVELAKHFPHRKPMDLSRDVVFGHEFCCEVLDYGPATTRKLKPGAHVCSHDYDPAPNLEKIEAPLLAINFADDLINPPELGILEREIKRVPHGRVIVIPFSDKTRGHGSHTLAALWKDQLADLLKQTEK